MRLPLILLVLSLAAAGAAYALGGSEGATALFIATLAGIAAAILAIKSSRARPTADFVAAEAPKQPKRKRRKASKHVVVDGSNVMHWEGDVARLTTLREVIKTLRAQGYQPGIVFDANAGYKLSDRYLDDGDFAKLLNLPGDRVLVVPRGEPADPTILAAARELQAKVVTNDRFRDWVGEFPEVSDPGHLMRGGVRDGAVWLDEAA